MRASKITAVDLFDDLSSPYARKRFFWGFIILAILTAVFIYFDNLWVPRGELKEVLDAVAIQLLANIIMIVAFYGLYLHFIGPNEGLRQITVTRSQDIGGRMKELPLNTRYYAFWGRSGSYFRVEPLQTLDDQSRRQKLVIDIEVVLPDPEDDRLIRSYQEILASLGERRDGNPLLANVLATTIACAVTAANNKYLRVKVFYSKFLPAFRVDLSDEGAILTQDDPGKSALFFESGSEFFEMFRATVRNEMNLSREIIWDKALFEGKSAEQACTAEAVAALGLAIDGVNECLSSVSKLLVEKKHRYK